MTTESSHSTATNRTHGDSTMRRHHAHAHQPDGVTTPARESSDRELNWSGAALSALLGRTSGHLAGEAAVRAQRTVGNQAVAERITSLTTNATSPAAAHRPVIQRFHDSSQPSLFEGPYEPWDMATPTSVPALPSTTGPSGPSWFPSMPSLPGFPSMPSLPGFPSMPSLPSMPSFDPSLLGGPYQPWAEPDLSSLPDFAWPDWLPGSDAQLEKRADQTGSGLDILGGVNDTVSLVKELGGKPYPSVIGAGLSVLTGLADFTKFTAQGQTGGEAFSSAAGKYVGTEATKELVGAHPMDIAVNLVDNAAKLGLPALGADEGTTQAVTDYTGMAADMTPTKFGGAIGSNLLRFGYNAVTGDSDAIDRQGKDILAGKSGAPLQGWGMLKSMGTDVYDAATSDKEYDFEQSLFKTANAGKGSSMERMGNAIGDEVFGIVNNDPSKSIFAEAAHTYEETGYGLTDWLSDEWKRF